LDQNALTSALFGRLTNYVNILAMTLAKATALASVKPVRRLSMLNVIEN